MSLSEGRGAWHVCARCEELGVIIKVGGLKEFLSRFTVPKRHAVILENYMPLYSLWPSTLGGFNATEWWAAFAPEDGTVHVKHICRFRP